MKKVAVYASMILVVSACGVKVEDTPDVPETPDVPAVLASSEEDVLEEITPQRPVYHGSETILTDLIHTKLEVNFDWGKSRMNGIATITAKPHFYKSSELILDAKGMDIHSVKMDGKELQFAYENDFLTIDLGKEYTRNEQYTVVIDYLAKPDERETGGSAAITSDKGLYFINPTGEDENKMPQIWTQGETEASSVWFPTIDSPNAKTTQEIFITVDEKYVTLSNGKMVSSKSLPNGMRVDHWKQELPHAPYLFMMGVGEFKVIEDTYTRPDGTKMTVNYYVEPEWESSAQHIFGETPEMIGFFSERLGVEYPWDKYNQIVVRDYVSGAMENTGAVIFGDFVYKNERELLDGNDQSIIAHELFHHWFGDLVTCESWSNLPLNESFANYSQYLWDEHRYGVDEADYYAEVEADGYYQTANIQGHHDLIWFDFDNKEEMFDGHSYNKGGRILHMLRNYLGDDAFFAGINNYLVKNKFKPAEFHQLRLAFEEVSGEDLNWFFNQWFLGSGHPVLSFKQEIDSTNHTLKVYVEQKQDLDQAPLYKLPFEIAVFDDKGKHIHEVVMDEVEEEFELPFSGELKGFVYDNEQMLLAKKRVKKSKEQYIYQYYNGERYAARRDGLKYGSKSRTEAGQQLILDAFNDEFWDIRLLALGKTSKLKDERRTQGIAKIKDMVKNDPKSSVRVGALKALGKLIEGDELVAIYTDRINNDPSYSVISTALQGLSTQDAESAMALAQNLENEKSSKMVAGVAQLYAAHGDETKFEFLKNTLNGTTVQGFDKLGVLNSLTYYLTRQDMKLLKDALPVYEVQAESGGFYTQLFLPQNLNHLVEHMDGEEVKLKEELAAYEKNDDAAYATQTRKKIAELDEIKKRYKMLISEIEKKNGGAQMMIQQSEEE